MFKCLLDLCERLQTCNECILFYFYDPLLFLDSLDMSKSFSVIVFFLCSSSSHTMFTVLLAAKAVAAFTVGII